MDVHVGKWAPGDVAYRAQFDYGREPEVCRTTVSRVTAAGLILQERMSAWRHRKQVPAAHCHHSAREALVELADRLRSERDSAQEQANALGLRHQKALEAIAALAES